MTAAEERPAPSFVETVRRFGLVSADAVVDRYVRLAEDALPGGAMARPPVPPDRGATAEGIARLTTAWLRLLDTTASLVDGVGASAAPETLVLRSPPGATAAGSLWVHDAASSPVAVALHGTSLVAPHGAVVAGSAVTFAAARPGPPDDGGAREVRVRVRVPAGQDAGRYHGLVLASTAPAPLLLVLEVLDRGAQP